MNDENELPTPALPDDKSSAAPRGDALTPEARERITRTRHEVNNLLTGIMGQAQLLLVRDDLDDAVRQRVKTIEDLVKRIKTSITQLNDV